MLQRNAGKDVEKDAASARFSGLTADGSRENKIKRAGGRKEEYSTNRSGASREGRRDQKTNSTKASDRHASATTTSFH